MYLHLLYILGNNKTVMLIPFTILSRPFSTFFVENKKKIHATIYISLIHIVFSLLTCKFTHLKKEVEISLKSKWNTRSYNQKNHTTTRCPTKIVLYYELLWHVIRIFMFKVHVVHMTCFSISSGWTFWVERFLHLIKLIQVCLLLLNYHYQLN